MTTTRFLVTGGAGFIGAALVTRLVHAGHHVRVLDNISRGREEKLRGVLNDIDLHVADVRDPEAVGAAVRGVDIVVHLAAVNGTEFFYSKPELVLDVGVRGMLAIIDGCRRHGVGDLVVASSSEVYQTPPKVPTDETAPLSVPDVMNPRYSYGGSKIITELMAINYGRIGFDRMCVFRPHNVYGPDMGWEHVLPQFVLRTVDLIAANPGGPIRFPIQGDGTQTRAFIHIDDFTEGLMRVIQDGHHLNIYHIGNPEELMIRDIARKVVNYFGRDVSIIEGPAMAGGTQRRCPDIRKLAALGFHPKISFDAGLPSIADWYAANAHLHRNDKSRKNN